MIRKTLLQRIALFAVLGLLMAAVAHAFPTDASKAGLSARIPSLQSQDESGKQL
jgi:hypothetical protein